MTFGEFWRKYKVLSESSNSMSGNLPVEKLKSAVQDLLEELDLDQTAVRLGNTQVGSLFIVIFDALFYRIILYYVITAFDNFNSLHYSKCYTRLYILKQRDANLLIELLYMNILYNMLCIASFQ